MRFGIFDQLEQPGGLPQAELYASRLALVERADRAGFWGYHKSEHHMIPLDHAPSTGLWLAAVAQRTTRIRVCSLVHLLPFYHPVRLIEEVSMLDHLSGGRFEFGIGKGVSAPEHDLWGLDPDEAIARTDEMLDLVLAALQCDDGLFSYDGHFHQLRDVPIEFGSLQLPYPPLWRPGKFLTAADLGVSTVVGGPISLVNESIEQYWERFDAGSQPLSAGRRPTVAAIRRFVVAPTDAEADRIGRRAWAAFSHNLTVLFRRYGLAVPNDPTIGGDYDRAKQIQAVVVGSPTTVRAHVDELAEAGLVDYLIGGFAFGDLNHDEVARSMDLFAEAVVGPLGDRSGADADAEGNPAAS